MCVKEILVYYGCFYILIQVLVYIWITKADKSRFLETKYPKEIVRKSMKLFSGIDSSMKKDDYILCLEHKNRIRIALLQFNILFILMWVYAYLCYF